MTKLYFAIEEALVVLAVEGDRARCDLHLHDENIGCVAVDPLNQRIVYCGTFGSGLWYSDDAGESWRPVGKGIRHSKVQSVSVSRSECVRDRGVVYVGTEPSAIFRSEDTGGTWRECTGMTELPSANEWSFPPRPETHHVRWIEPDPHVAGRLFVAVEAGALIRTFDSGNTWQDRTAHGPRDTHQLSIHHSTPDRLCSAAGDGYFESRDGGETWQRFEEGLRHRYLWSIAVDAADAENIILSAAASARHSHFKPAESYLYRRTADSPWHELRDGLPNPAGRRTAVLAADPKAPGTFYAAWERDVFRSIDGGARWRRLNVAWPEDCRINELCALAVANAGDEISAGTL
jgi:BNR/Asp-box repeat protein